MLDRALVKISDKGRLVIPAEFRKALGLRAGDVLDLRIVENELRLTSFRNNILHAREQLKKYRKPGVDMLEDFLAERRLEGAREEQEAEEWSGNRTLKRG